MQAIYIVGYIIIGILLVAGFALFTYFVIKTVLQAAKDSRDMAEDFMKWAKTHSDYRAEEAAKMAIMEGEMENRSFMEFIENLLQQSGVSALSGGITAEMFTGVWAAVVILGTGISALISRNIIIVAGMMMVFAFAPYLVISIMAHANVSRVQEMLIIFCDTAANVSMSTTNLMELLRKTGSFMGEPLNSALQDAYIEAINGADGQWMALQRLRQRIPEKQFISIIQDLEIAARHEADYASILHDRKEMIEMHIASKKKKEALIREARINIGIMFFVCFLCFYNVSDLIEGGMLAFLTKDIMGIMLLAALFLVALYSLYVCFASNGE